MNRREPYSDVQITARFPTNTFFPKPIDEYPVPVRTRDNRNFPKGYDPLRRNQAIAPEHREYPEHVLHPAPHDQTRAPLDNRHNMKTSIAFHHVPLTDNNNQERGNDFSHHYSPKYLYGRPHYMVNAHKGLETIGQNVVSKSHFYPQRSYQFRSDRDYRQTKFGLGAQALCCEADNGRSDYRVYPHMKLFIDGQPYHTNSYPFRVGSTNPLIEGFNMEKRHMSTAVLIVVILSFLFLAKNV